MVGHNKLVGWQDLVQWDRRHAGLYAGLQSAKNDGGGGKAGGEGQKG